MEAMANPSLDSAALDSDSGGVGLEREPSISRSSSSVNLLDPPPQPDDPAVVGRPRRKDKGKGKEVEGLPLRVKEEPKAFLLNPPESPPSNLVRLHFTKILNPEFILSLSSTTKTTVLLAARTARWFTAMAVLGLSTCGA